MSRLGSRPLVIALPLMLAVAQAWASPAAVTRGEWGAKPPVMEMSRQTPVRLTVHHTAVRANPRRGLEEKLRGLQAFSQSSGRLADGRPKKAWGDVPYHFYIDVSGKVGEGLPVRVVGDTNTQYDPTGHIGIVLEGNFETERPSAAQIDSLVTLLAALAAEHAIDPGRIGAHRDFARTACPGSNLLAMLPGIVADVRARLAAMPDQEPTP